MLLLDRMREELGDQSRLPEVREAQLQHESQHIFLIPLAQVQTHPTADRLIGVSVFSEITEQFLHLFAVVVRAALYLHPNGVDGAWVHGHIRQIQIV